MTVDTTRVVRTMCPMNCHPTFCGMRAHVDGNRLIKVEGDPNNPDSRGFLCIRGQASFEVIDNPRRLRAPLVRTGDRGTETWAESDWDTMLGRIVQAMQVAGRERVALWMGHGVFINGVGRALAARFANLYGCQHWNPGIVCWALGGYGLSITGVLQANTKEDLAAHSRTVVLWGANIASQPGLAPHLVEARRRGAHVTLVDIRRTETTTVADETLLIRPGTDAALALAMMQEIISEDLVDRKYVANHTVGFDALASSVQHRTPEWAASVTGLQAETIRALARRYATQRPSVIVMGGSSMFKQRSGWQTSRAISCLPALTGNLGVAGGGLGPRHRAFVPGEANADITAADRRPPGTYVPSHMESMTAAFEQGEIDVLVLLGTNMLSSFADANAVERALEKVKLVVSFDLFINETIRRCADVVLPGTAWLEETGLKDTAGYIHLMDQALEPPDGCRSLGWLARTLADRLGVEDVCPWGDQVGAVNAMLGGLDGGQLTIDRMRASGGYYARQTVDVPYTDHRFLTPSGKVEFLSERAVELGLTPLPEFEPPESPNTGRIYPLTFKQGRTLNHFHAFYDEGRALPTLARAERFPELWINGADANERAVGPGQLIELFNDRGAFQARARVTDDIPPGVVWMRDGWVGVNRLTSGRAALDVNASAAFPATVGGQASYEALVEVRPL